MFNNSNKNVINFFFNLSKICIIESKVFIAKKYKNILLYYIPVSET